jgi:hypothetical protein
MKESTVKTYESPKLTLMEIEIEGVIASSIKDFENEEWE